MPQTRPLSQTLKNYGRSVVGGLLFATASLYTMEIWWQGYTLPPHVVLTTFLSTLVILTAYAYYAGIKHDETLRENVYEAFETLALGMLVTVVVLKLAGQLPSDMGWVETVQRVVKSSIVVSIGVAIGTTQLGESDDDDAETSQEKSDRSLGHRLALSALGAILVGSSVAPTEEVMMIGVQSPPWGPLATTLLTLLVAVGVVSYTAFKGSARSTRFAGGAVGDAAVTYAVSVLVAAALLWSSGHFAGLGALARLDLVVFLAFPCTLGAAAGRLLL